MQQLLTIALYNSTITCQWNRSAAEWRRTCLAKGPLSLCISGGLLSDPFFHKWEYNTSHNLTAGCYIFLFPPSHLTVSSSWHAGKQRTLSPWMDAIKGACTLSQWTVTPLMGHNRRQRGETLFCLFFNCVQKSYKRLYKVVQTHKPAASRERVRVWEGKAQTCFLVRLTFTLLYCYYFYLFIFLLYFSSASHSCHRDSEPPGVFCSS